MRFLGEFVEGNTYPEGDIVVHDGKAFVSAGGTWHPVAAEPDPALLPRDGATGPQGSPGKDGLPGESIVGPPGESIVGPPGIGFNWRGEWKRAEYAPMDCVFTSGSSYVCVAPTKSEPPGKAWQLLAAGGAKGEDGESFTSVKFRTVQGETAPTVQAIFDSVTPRGAVVYISGNSHVDQAQANGEPQALAVGIAAAQVGAGEIGRYVPHGIAENPDWSLTPGTVYYLDPDVPGGITSTYPTTVGDFVVIVGTATTPTQLNVAIHWSRAVDA